MHQLAENLWIYDQPHHMFGINFGARMTVVRDDEGALWLHSPIDTAMLRDELLALGPVRAVVAPNQGHYVGLGEAQATFPEAKAYAIPDAATRVGIPAELPGASAGAGILARRLRGSRIIDETVFLHVASKTLILCDLAMNLQHLTYRERVLARLISIPPRFGTSGFTRALATDRESMRQAAYEVIRWDFDRVIVSHGDVIETDGKRVMRKALAWI